MKFIRLAPQDWPLYADDFSKFLAVQGIDKALWDKYKSQSLEKVDELMDQFSDLVYQTVLEKARYLEWVEPSKIMAFCYTPIKAHGLVLQPSNSSFEKDISKLTLDQIQVGLKSGDLELYQTQKNYGLSREQDMFDWMSKSGAYISEGQWYQQLLACI